MTDTFPTPRVALIASSLRLAGAEKQTVYIARALLDAGTDTRFFYLGEGGYYETVLRQMGVSVAQIYRRNRPMFILAQLSRALRRFRPQVVFAPQFGDLLQAGIAGRLCGALTLGGLRSDGFYELAAHGRWGRWMLRLAHGLIANSHCVLHNLASRGGDPSRIKVLSNVVDLGEFDERSKMAPPFSASADRVVAVAIGRLQPSKRFDRFLKALALAREKAPALLGVIVGADGGCGSALAREAVELGLAPDHVVFLGECREVPAVLAQANFLVLCSEYEGFPNVILEAMAAGRPVVTARVGDAERIVKNDQTGYVVNGSDVEALSQRMATLALCPATRTRLGAQGRSKVARDYDYMSLPNRLLSVFQEFAVSNRRSELVSAARALTGLRHCSGTNRGCVAQYTDG